MTKTSLKVTLLDLLENCNVCRYLDKLKLYYAFSFLGAAPPAESAPGLLLPTFSLQATEHTIASDFFPSDIFTLLKSSHEFEPPSKSLSHRQECSPCEVLNREDQVQNEVRARPYRKCSKTDAAPGGWWCNWRGRRCLKNPMRL